MNKNIFEEVNKKIGNLQKSYSSENYHENSYINLKDLPSKEWESVNDIGVGVKMKKIENISKNNKYGSVILYAPKNTIIGSHSHPQIEICVCLSGNVKITTKNNDKYYLNPIESAFIRPNELHTIEFIEESQIMVSWVS